MAETPNQQEELRISTEQYEIPQQTAVNTFAHKFRMLALLAMGSAATGPQYNCMPDENHRIEDTRNTNAEVIDNNGPFELYYLSSVLTSDGQENAGIMFGYTLKEDLIDARVQVLDFDGQLLYEQNHNLIEGQGNLIFIEPDIKGKNSAQFEGAANAASVIIKGIDSNGEPFEVAASTIE
jgi:hypothetical protein